MFTTKVPVESMTFGASVSTMGTARLDVVCDDAAMTAPAPRRTGTLLQTAEEISARDRALTEAMAALIGAHGDKRTGRALDVGCQAGRQLDRLALMTGHEWVGIDPILEAPALSDGGARLLPGSSDAIPFPDATFDVVLLANVWEHISPSSRDASVAEMRRVLAPGGIVVGQLPNPYFPVESHSRLPFLGWLPRRLQRAYWRLSPVWWQHDFYTVTVHDLRRRMLRADMEPLAVRGFNYPLDAIPKRVRPLARLASVPMRVVPWSWQFCFRRPG
jgi:SAM-dependent methyltransferase